MTPPKVNNTEHETLAADRGTASEPRRVTKGALDLRMGGNQPKRPSKERPTWLDAVPRRRAAGMWKADHVRREFLIPDPMLSADHLNERTNMTYQLFNRERPNRQDQPRPQDCHLALEEVMATLHLVRRRLSISPAPGLTGKASRYRREVDPLSKERFLYTQGVPKPCEHRPPCGPGKRFAKPRFSGSRCLADQQNSTHHRRSMHHRPYDAWAGAARLQPSMQLLELGKSVHIGIVEGSIIAIVPTDAICAVR